MKITTLSTLLSAALFTASGTAQNLLTNPSFENGLTGWNTFGPNIFAEMTNPQAGIVPRTGNTLCKMFGAFVGGFNATGIFQSFPAVAGQTFTIDCWSRHYAFDPLTGMGAPNDNWAVMKIAFFDAAGIEIGNAERTVLDGTFPTNTWIDNAAVSGTAPAGTVQVQALIIFLQPAVAGGSAQFDDIEFTLATGAATYPGTREDLVLSSAVGGGMLSTGQGNDVKTATGGNLLEFNVASPGGTYNLSGYWLIGHLFPTGSPPVPLPTFPELWFSFSSFFVIVDGSGVGTLGPPRIGPNGGTSTFLLAPSGLAGTSAMVQALIISPMVANGQYAASDAHEIRFQ